MHDVSDMIHHAFDEQLLLHFSMIMKLNHFASTIKSTGLWSYKTNMLVHKQNFRIGLHSIHDLEFEMNWLRPTGSWIGIGM